MRQLAPEAVRSAWPPVLKPDQVALAQRLRSQNEPIAVIARAVGCSHATVYRYTAAEPSTVD